MDCAEDVTVYVKGTCLCCLKDYLERVVRRHCDTCIQIISNSEPMRLGLVMIAYNETHHIPLVNEDDWPWMNRRPMAHAIIET